MRLKELNPQKGEVVRIKFKSINEIMSTDINNKDFHEIEKFFQIQNNIKAYLASGDFLVAAAVSTDEDHAENPYIEVKNHLDHNYNFCIHESVIESIEMVDAAQTFCSHDLKLVAVRIGHEMYINGHPLIWNESELKDEDDDYSNHNRKFISMLESFVADLAVRDAFKEEKREG